MGFLRGFLRWLLFSLLFGESRLSNCHITPQKPSLVKEAGKRYNSIYRFPSRYKKFKTSQILTGNMLLIKVSYFFSLCRLWTYPSWLEYVNYSLAWVIWKGWIWYLGVATILAFCPNLVADKVGPWPLCHISLIWQFRMSVRIFSRVSELSVLI